MQLSFIQVFLFIVITEGIYNGSCHSTPTIITTDIPITDIAAKLLRDFQAKLPAKYFCCKENLNQRLNVNETQYIDKHDKEISNISILSCPRIRSLPVSSALRTGSIFFVEGGYVYVDSSRSIYGMRYGLIPKCICFFNKFENGTSELRVIGCSDYSMLEEDEEEEETVVFKKNAPVAGALALASAPFLILVIFVYASIPELRDTQGSTILCLCCCYLLSSVLIANEDLQLSKEHRLCQSGGDIIYLTLMTSIFWMNAITVDTFLSIRYTKLMAQWTTQFVWYSLYAWGVPGFLLLCAMFVDVTPGSLVLSGMEERFNCPTYGDAVQWIFYVGPMIAAITVSGMLLLYSGVLLWMQPPDPQQNILRYKLILTLKLFAVVVMSWLNEPFQKIHGEQNIMWVLGDCWNLLQGVLLFLILVLLRKRAMHVILNNYTSCASPWVRKYTDSMSKEEEAAGFVDEEQGAPDNNVFNDEYRE